MQGPPPSNPHSRAPASAPNLRHTPRASSRAASRSRRWVAPVVVIALSILTVSGWTALTAALASGEPSTNPLVRSAFAPAIAEAAADPAPALAGPEAPPPTAEPTAALEVTPTAVPTPVPTVVPTVAPTPEPAQPPEASPTVAPTPVPTAVPVATAPAAAAGPPPTLALSTRELGLLDAMNAARAERGLPALTLRQDLTEVARARSEEMTRLGYFDHFYEGGTSAYALLAAAGVTYSAGGENLAKVAGDPATSVTLAIQALMDSPTHRDNILGGAYTRVGVGAVTSSEGITIFTMIFTDR